VPDITVVLPSVLQPLAGGQSVLTAPADGAVTVGSLLDSITSDYPVLARRIRDETGALRRYVNVYVDGEVLVIQSVAGG
jgi:molybdopterin converting factor small subunit